MTASASDDGLQEFLRPGLVANDIPALFGLRKARDLLRAFSTLFHGGEDAVMVRLLVLRTIGERGAAPDWSPQELREHFAYVDATKLDTVLARLRDNSLLAWDPETQRYRVSPVGRQALSALTLLLQFQGEGDELDPETLHWPLYAALTDNELLAEPALAAIAAHVQADDPISEVERLMEEPRPHFLE